MKRHAFPTHFEGFAFSMLIPDGFEICEVPDVDIDTNDPDQSRPIAMLASMTTGAHLAVAVRPTYHTGSVTDWLDRLTERFKLTVTGAIPAFVGGMAHQHPAMLVEATQTRSGETEIIRIAGFEDDGSFFTVHSRCPEARWAELAHAIEASVASVELREPVMTTVSVVRNGPVVPHDMPDATVGEWPRGQGLLREPKPDMAAWDAAVTAAAAKIDAGQFDDAERLLGEAERAAEQYGRREGTLADMYLSKLKAFVASGKAKRDPAAADALFARASRWAMRWPDPHTEYEAEQAAIATAEIRARLVAVLGREPRA